MVRVIRIYTIIQVALIFIKTKKEANCLWALTLLRKSLEEDSPSEVILIHCELALMNVIHEHFSIINFFLFR